MFGNRPVKVGAVEVGNANPGESKVRRNIASKDAMHTVPIEGVETVFDILAYSARTHGNKNTFGMRTVLKVHEEFKDLMKTADGVEVVEKKQWQYFELSEYKYITFTEVKQHAEAIGRGLLDLGLKKGDIFNIFAATAANWQLVSFACASISITIATSYDTLGEIGLTHALKEPECTAVFTNADLFPMLLKVLPNTPTVKFVIYDGTPKPELLEKLKAVRENVTILTIGEVKARGESFSISPEEAKALLPKPSDVHCIMYTSGSMGTPKGVEITHANIVASVAGMHHMQGSYFEPDDTFLAFLPLAHIFEFCVELLMFFIGMTTGYGKVKTLSDGSVRNCKGDFREFRPSTIIGVPAIFETLRKGILTQVNASGTIRRSVFNASVSIKKAGVPGMTQVVDSLVFNKVKAATGGRLKMAFTGSAALSLATHEFLNTVLAIVVQGYGMTEASGIACGSNRDLHYTEAGALGIPLACVEIKLVDLPDVGYLTTNNPPRGELLMRGPSVVRGYFKRPDLNSDPTIFTLDGWFRTGDIGQFNADGTVTLIDRVKNLIKLQDGEYIAVEYLESIFKSCNFVNSVCLYANSGARQPMALIVPHEAQLRQFLKSEPLDNVDEKASFEQLCRNDAVNKLILDTCNAVGKKSGFGRRELLEAVVLSHIEWTPENGLVTAAQKLGRKALFETFESKIKEVYPY